MYKWRQHGLCLGPTSSSMAELKAPWVGEHASMDALTWVIALVQMLYNSWRIFVDHHLLMEITFTRMEPNLGYVFNWDVGNIFLFARFLTYILGIVAACVLTVGNCQRLLKRRRIGRDLEEFIAGWRSLTVCQPCVILLEVTLALLCWDTQGLIKLLSRWVLSSCTTQN